MLQRINQRAFLLFVLATGAMLILASGLSEVRLLPGIPGPIAPASQLPLPELLQLNLGGNELIFYSIFFCLILAIIALALVPEGRVRLVKLALVVAALYLLSQLLAPGLPVQTAQVAETGAEESAGDEESRPSATLQPGIAADFETPGWLVTMAGIGVALLLVGAGAGVAWFFLKARFAASPTEEISLNAQAAVDALLAGGNYQDIVLSCYARMIQVLFEQRSVSRESAMTAHEFEGALIKLGFPAEPIRTLTHLFEEVRYGSIQPGENGRQMAISSLNAIVSYCTPPEPA